MQIIAIYPQIKGFYALGKNIIDKISNGIFAKESFDIIERKIIICNRDSCLFFVDGLINDEVMEKIIELQEQVLSLHTGMEAEQFAQDGLAAYTGIGQMYDSYLGRDTKEMRGEDNERS